MLMNLFILWILMSVFFGSREANRMASGIFGILAFFWILGLIIRCGIGLLPIIIVIVLVTKVIMPFCRGFMSRLNMHR